MTTTGQLGTLASRLGWIVLGAAQASDSTTAGAQAPQVGTAAVAAPVIRSALPPSPVIRYARSS